jgi:tRNA threonylcarbamoyladenosine biosynthesis protein TsaE
MKREFRSEEEMSAYAKEFLRMLTPNTHGATLVGLSGDLGSGKTTFTKLFAAALGISEQIVSPTYVIAKFYDIPKQGVWGKLVHIDAYRIEEPNEVRALRWEELTSDPKNLILVEWPERIGPFFPGVAPLLRFEFVNEATRAILYESREIEPISK